MTASPEISAAYARLALRSGLLSEAQMLEGTGVSAEYLTSVEYVDWRILAVMFGNIDGHPGQSSAWAARLGGQFNISAHGALGFAALSAPTLGGAFEAMLELYPSRVTAIGLALEKTDGYHTLRVFDVVGDVVFSGYLAEIILKVAESLLAAILGHPVAGNVLVSLSRPAGEVAAEFTSVFDAPLAFGAGGHCFSIPASWWRLPSPLHDESTYWANVAKCRELIASREHSGSATFNVRMHLKNYFDRQITGNVDPVTPPTQQEIAQTMHLTTRTLIRHLQGEGSAYKQILEELRRDYAQYLLANARLTVADVGELLGYGEAANFGRAFRRWFGCSPAVWRHREPGVGGSD